MKLAADIHNLADNIRTSFDARMNFLGENSQNTKQIKQNARKFIGMCRRNHKAMAEHLHTDLGTFTENLKTTVKGLKKGFHHQQDAFRQECKSMHNAFQKLQKEMRDRRCHDFANEHQSGRTLKNRKH